MKKGRLFFLNFAFLFILVFVVSSCDLFKTENPVGPSGDDKIQYENEKSLINTQVSAGSVVTIVSPNHALDGMRIDISDGSFSDSRKIDISSYDIKSHNFGQYFNPISPLIKISSNGGYIDGLFEVAIPIKLEIGSFPLIFIYDDVNKKLEPLPVQKYDANSVTFTTRHFATSNLMAERAKKNTPLLQSDEGYSLILVSSLQESIINQTPIISSGFKPGVDDWEFPNRGSYIAPGGHCAGQNMAAMWYYFEKKLKGEPGLFNLMNTVNNIWQENNRGYRFCSVLQEDLSWRGRFIDFFDKYIDKNQDLDKLKFYMIAGAMLVTGEPQGIGVYVQEGTRPNGTPKYGGHDLICYQLEPSSGKLYISDPNYPGKGQVINFKNNKFEPYQASYKAGNPPTSFPFITYYAKTAYIEWDKIKDRWKEIENYKIGNDKFPSAKLWSPDNGGFYIEEEEFDYNIDTLILTAETPTTDAAYDLYGKRLAQITIFDENGAKIISGDDVRIKFTEPKVLKFGILIEGFTEKSKYDNGDYVPEYIDFRWLSINYSKYAVNILPEKQVGDINQEYTWNLDISALPKDLKYYIKWNFGDGKGDIKKDNINFINYTYQTSGTYKVKASIFDAKTNKELARDSAVAEIAGAGNMSPNFGPGGQTIIIKGSGFKDPKYTEIDGTLHWDIDSTNHNYRALQTKVVDDNTLEVIVNDDSKNTIGKVYIKVRKYISNQMKYEWIGPWEYEIVKIKVDEIKPDTMRTNTEVTIKGSGFGIFSPHDIVQLGLTPANRIISWTNTEIVFEAPEMDYNGTESIYIAKSCESAYQCYRHDIGSKYWEPLKSDIINLMKTAFKEGNGSVSADMICNFKYYNDKGEVTSQKELSHRLDESLYNTSQQNIFKVNGRDFEGTIYKNPYGKVIYSGTISADGKKAETMTMTRYNENDKVIQKITINDLPLKSIYKSKPKVSWKYEDSQNGAPYISEFYYAVYWANGKLQYDATMKSCSKLTFDFQFEYK